MPKLTFDEFSRANEARKKQFFKDASAEWSIADAFMAATGEFGEIADSYILLAAARHLGEMGNALKKVRRAELGMLNKNAEGRQINSLDEAKAKVAGEIGGFMCYLDQLCVQIGLRLQNCIVDEFNTKSKELDLPERIIDGRFMLATTGKFKLGENGPEYDEEIYSDPPEEKKTISFSLDTDANLVAKLDPSIESVATAMEKSYSEVAADIARSKYRAAWPHVTRFWEREIGKHPGLAAPYGEQPFNERGIVGTFTEDPKQSDIKRTLKIPAEELRSQHSFDYKMGPAEIDRLEIGGETYSPINIYNFDEPVRLVNGMTYIFGVDKNDQAYCRPLLKRPTVWTDGCALCRWCAMEPDCDPYCTNPDVKAAAGATVGIGLNGALQTCGADGFLRLFEPRK